MTRHNPLGPGREFDLIRDFVRGLPDSGIAVGPGDDCAVLPGGIVVSTDASVEGVHFRREWLSADEIGYRAAAVALSDLAAVAAEPIALFVSLGLPPTDYGDFAVRIMEGVQRAAARYGAALAGGDTTGTSGPLWLDVAAVGRAESPVLRSGAQAGDHIYVTGRLGGAAAAVHAWPHGAQPSAAARRAYAEPAPRVAEARWLAAHIDLHALIDLSDGLSSDAAHIAAASKCGIELHMSALPIAADATWQLALAGGDDYELCFAAAPADVEQARSAFEAQFGITLTDIGRVIAGAGVRVLDQEGNTMTDVPRGWDHFGSRA